MANPGLWYYLLAVLLLCELWHGPCYPSRVLSAWLPCSDSDTSHAIGLQRERHYMKIALREARQALKLGEVPVGCVVVFEDEIIAQGHNLGNTLYDGTRHAELIAIDSLVQNSDFRLLEGCEVFVTCEPCIMCASALGQLNVKRVVMGCRNLFFGGCGSVISINAKSALGKCLERGFKCEWGVEEEAAIELLRIFYSGKNPRAPNPKFRRKSFR
ncbi:hypothetical protein GUITHDRAFT_80172 [Guillardia theta CCMP2712]|uniref:CMP/dCMP-type deaminase domain-containing protein n=1 Tax=Guillardia theta (strain CCMP2712) TaxID=905079 RepID=L1IFX9_GUITC|nr:hypothetical protein GUITHDRAFT_80172 [Guillardia theta CCMP2712]EKX34987.1 hypothetical protein GUITHDRAFT_80172 [Guillardia theta CCMP2712]|eukprot:XP_005821967.1 hypothetical protein GUITHDRAFT_80172 [Guillardia theta CCMP2712]